MRSKRAPRDLSKAQLQKTDKHPLEKRKRRDTALLQEIDKRQLMERIRFEVAQELGLEELMQGELGDATTAQCGKFGALLQKRTQELLEIRHVPKN